ncbi:hypothetical protein [Formosa algae]|uniref:Lipoprotein n=1 Tax=Formosa algae TaxID=225843 RepID=A0A9X0YJE7_9FLAO|nr:hypothetical protein [Formosa algae]MBP1839008.1 hypothetical protein [Formosa algae]MDQ0333785.1 hypothetical protein [Formosa algae]
MKNLLYICFVMLSVLSFTSCQETDTDTVVETEGEAGVLVNVSNYSSGALLGSPESGKELDEASIEFSESYLTLVVTKQSGDFSQGVESIQAYKSLNGGEEILIGSSESLPFSVEYTTIEEFVDGTGLDVADLRIGDSFSFIIKVVKTDGSVYTYNTSMGRFLLAINCSYDLNGTYTMTNSVCGSEVEVEISQNSDGTWYASTADGGLLQYCTTNTTLQNFGSFAVSCGGIVDASTTAGGPDYCEGGDYGIGCITGGTWDQETGILQMTHNDAFFGVGAYTSTYVRK